MSRITRFTRLRWLGAAALLAVTPLLGAQAPDLNALLREVEQAARQGGEINREREARFVRQRSEQQTLLREAEAEQKARRPASTPFARTSKPSRKRFRRSRRSCVTTSASWIRCTPAFARPPAICAAPPVSR